MSEIYNVNGLAGSSSLYFIAKHFERALIILPENKDIYQAQETLKFFTEEKNPVHIYPAFERLYWPVRQEPQSLIDRLYAQWNLSVHKQKDFFMLTSLEALSQKTISQKELSSATLEIKKGDFFDRDELIKKLLGLGFKQDDLAEDHGFFSVRGPFN